MSSDDQATTVAAPSSIDNSRRGGEASLPKSADPLEQFLKSFLAKGSPVGYVPVNGAVHYIDGVTAVLWHRNDPFQIQLFVVPPNYIIPEHTHPNVDSYEIYVGGQIRFSHSGKYVHGEADLNIPNERGLSKVRGAFIRVRPNDKHGGVFGPSGGVFFSVQRWLNGVKPHCVSADYTGVVLGPEHLASVKFGEAELKPSLTATDAAPDEGGAGWSKSS